MISQESVNQNEAFSSQIQPKMSRIDANGRGSIPYGVGKSRLSQYVQ